MTFIVLSLKISILLTEFSLGLRANHREALTLLRYPSLFARSMFGMYIVVPLFSVGIAAAFELSSPVEIALVALALSPVPPLLPRKQMIGGGSHSYVVSLFVMSALFSIGFVPLALAWLARIFAIDLHMPPGNLARFVLLIILAPLAAGMLVRGVFPRLAEKVADPINKIAFLILGISVLFLVALSWGLIDSLIGNGTILAFIAFTLIGMAAGHFLGGPDHENRNQLALAAASRHPGMAIAIATVNFPNEKKLVMGAILLYLIVSVIVTLPYLFRKPQGR